MTARFSDVRWFEEVGSTNSVATDLARRGAASPSVVVVADHQTDGRGRRGRHWEAPPRSSLLVSVLLPPATAERPAHLASLAMALAASDACEEVAGVRPLLKWPNDLVVDAGKVGGILGEAAGAGVVVGLGLNVNWEGAAPPEPGVALDALTGSAVDRRALLDALLRHLDRHLGVPSEELVEACRQRSATLGQRVRVELASGTVDGLAVAISSHGHLVVEEDGGPRHVIAAGDVIHVRPDFR